MLPASALKLLLSRKAQATIGHVEWQLKYMFDMQAVLELYEVAEGAAWGRGSGRGTRVVVIGCRLQGAELE